MREIYVPRETTDNELYDEIHTISSGINFDHYENIKVEVCKKIKSSSVPIDKTNPIIF